MDANKLEYALTVLSKKTGIPPEKLREMAMSGKVDSLISSPMGKEILGDKKKMEQLLQNPQVVSFLKKMLKERDSGG